MSHAVPSLAEQSEQEILIPVSSYPDSQRKDWLSAESRDIVGAGLYQPEAWSSDDPRDSVAAGMSYDKTDEMSVTSRSAEQHVVQHDGRDPQESGPGQGRLPSSSAAFRVSRGRSTEEAVETSEDGSPSGVPI
eukprot:8260391-Pyramimonas_sp.AAC.1